MSIAVFTRALLAALLSVASVDADASTIRAIPSPQAAVVFAGSGALGFADGPARAATFVEPIGVTFDVQHDRVIVADAGAQRIRSVDAQGIVHTLAGGGTLGTLGIAVPGDYRDGPAAVARFNRPEAVIVDRDGSVIVADTRNHCLRRIRDGVVTTIAGSPLRPGKADGPTRAATFELPRSLAFDSDGTLYIADWGNGLRMLGRDGNVKTVPTAVGSHAVAVAFAHSASTTQMLVSSGIETFGIEPGGGRPAFWSADPNTTDASGIPGALEGGIGTGQIVNVFALGPSEYLYTAADSNQVHYVHINFGAPLQTSLDQVGDLDSPTGIAVLGDGHVLVADSGHRRLVAMPAPDRRIAYPAQELPPAKNANTYRIAYLGNSYIHYDVWWNDSISARVEQALARDAPAVGLRRRVEMYPVRFGPFAGLRDYAVNVAASGLFDAVVLQVNAGFFYSEGFVPYWSDLAREEPSWLPRFASDLRDITRALKEAHVPLVVIVQPMESEIGPLERIGGFELEGAGIDSATQGHSTHSLARAVASVANTCLFDMTAAFANNERSLTRVPLFEPNGDIHFSAEGVEFVAARVSEELESCRPWSGDSGAGG